MREAIFSEEFREKVGLESSWRNTIIGS